jgi:hypothetical protein
MQERAEKIAARDAALAAKGMEVGERSVRPAIQEDDIKGWGHVAVAAVNTEDSGWGLAESCAVVSEAPSSKAWEDSQSAQTKEGTPIFQSAL